MTKIKPSKKHYDKFVRQSKGVYCTKTECLCMVSTSIIAKIDSNDTFYSYQPTELAVSYGLKHKLLELVINKADIRYTDIGFTDLGFSKLPKQTTCILTGYSI